MAVPIGGGKSSSSTTAVIPTAAAITGGGHHHHHHHRKQHYARLLVFWCGCALSFYLGTLWSLQFGVSNTLHGGGLDHSNNNLIHNNNNNNNNIKQQQKQQREEHRQLELSLEIKQQREENRKLRLALNECKEQRKGEEQNEEEGKNKAAAEEKPPADSPKKRERMFPHSVSNYAHSMATVPKHKFFNRFDIGVPMDDPTEEEKDVLILYNGVASQPTRIGTGNNNNIQHIDDADKAFENCDLVNVMLLFSNGNKRKQCLAMVPNYEAFHFYRYGRVGVRGDNGTTAMRNAINNKAVDSGNELQLISRGYQVNGHTFSAPKRNEITNNWKTIEKFLSSQEDITNELKPLLASIAVDNTVVVMVCNFGQSELLTNFVCSARSRNLDISMVVVFATDTDTLELARSLGLAAFYEERIFGDLSVEEAKVYGDRRFVEMMNAKSICVTYVSMLGYDFLFQDVDVIWYRHPLDFFHGGLRTSGDFYRYEIFFQDDGGRQFRYAPLSGNSGFYYVRHNERTQWLMASILFSGEVIERCHSHQQLFIQKMNEFVSYLGLKVKIFSRTMEEFPSGYHFHQSSKRYMKAFFRGERHPIIFHMSWTKNKDDKLKFFQQIGGWYVRDPCIHKRTRDIMPLIDGGGDDAAAAATTNNNNHNNSTKTNNNNSKVTSFCCYAKPRISCHYRDKPSIKPCKNSPPIDSGKPSWW